jgi:putative ABC transport system permease protein
MSYSLTTLWHDRQRFLPGVLAVSFSAVLIALQCGLLLGLFSVTSIPIDHTRAHIWLGPPSVLSVDVARPIPEWYLGRLASQPEVEQCEIYIQAFGQWVKPTGGAELCIVIGSRLEDNALGSVEELTPELRTALTEPGSVVIDDSELDRLAISGIGATSEINGHRVRVVGMVHGLKSIAGPYIFCSIETARAVLMSRMSPDPYKATYILARCHNPADAAAVVQRLRDQDNADRPTMAVFTSHEFSLRSRLHWLFKTKAGIALGYAALLGLLVGAVVTSQTLYAATAASIREYAVLQALGIPRWRMAMAVMSQSFWVGISGVIIALPTVFLLAWVADVMGARVMLPPELLAGAGVVTLVMAVLSGLAAMRSLRLVEPAILLR